MHIQVLGVLHTFQKCFYYKLLVNNVSSDVATVRNIFDFIPREFISPLTCVSCEEYMTMVIIPVTLLCKILGTHDGV